MQLSIVIVNWNTGELLKKCLDSIYQYTQNLTFEVFVVDNNSTDNSLELINSQLPNLIIFRNQKNFGFASANNQALKQAGGEYLLLLNPDTELTENSFSIMLDFFAKHSDCGVLGCRLLNSDNSLQPSCRADPTLLSQILILTKIHNLLPNLKPIKRYSMADFNYAEIREVDEVMGACLMIRRETLEQVGLLDERFWLLFDEVDYCYRVKLAGWKIYFTPQTSLVHHRAVSFSHQKMFLKQKTYNASLLKFFKKHYPIWQWFILGLFQPISYLTVAGLKLLLILKLPLVKNKKI
jgi:GT2 family glycosyltransferase